MRWLGIDDFLKSKKPNDAVSREELSHLIDKNRIEIQPIELGVQGRPAKYSHWNPFRTGTNPKEILLQARVPDKPIDIPEGVPAPSSYLGEPRLERKKSTQYGFRPPADLQSVNKIFGRGSLFSGFGYSLPYEEFKNQVSKPLYNKLEQLSQSKGVQWAEAYIIPWERDITGRTPATSAVRKLLVEGVDIDGNSYQLLVDRTSMQGETRIAVGNKGSKRIVDYLRENNITVNDYPREQRPRVPAEYRVTYPDAVPYKEPSKPPKDFTGGHYANIAPNIAAHIRTWDLPATGEKVLGVGEIQSDWGSALRKAEESNTPPERRGEIYPPDFPFKEGKWIDMALKYVLRYAAENGYNRVVFPKGEQVSRAIYMGREHAQNLYDNLIPDRLNKLGKQYGVKPEDADIEIGNRRQTMLGEETTTMRGTSFNITPEMKSDILRRGFQLGFGLYLLNLLQQKEEDKNDK